MIAALFVETNGCYYGLPDVDPWDVARDARAYPGHDAVVAHPPCERWGRYWYGGPMRHKLGKRYELGDDAGCFAAAIGSVRACGVLEHPEASHAWLTFGLLKPPRGGGWIKADDLGYTCCVEQGWYGHRARKATWLYAVRTALPELRWGRAPGDFVRLDAGYHSVEERRKAVRLGTLARLPKRERARTPLAFRDVLLEVARSVT